MYSTDYDSLIERLTKTRDEIDDTIKILERRKEKDSVINNILSNDYEDEAKEEAEELEKLLKDILKGEAVEKIITNNKLPYRYRRYYYPWSINSAPDVWYRF